MNSEKITHKRNAAHNLYTTIYQCTLYWKQNQNWKENHNACSIKQQAVREAAKICPPPPRELDLLTLKVVSVSRVTWATSVPILVFSRLRPDVCDQQTSDSIIV